MRAEQISESVMNPITEGRKDCQETTCYLKQKVCILYPRKSFGTEESDVKYSASCQVFIPNDLPVFCVGFFFGSFSHLSWASAHQIASFLEPAWLYAFTLALNYKVPSLAQAAFSAKMCHCCALWKLFQGLRIVRCLIPRVVTKMHETVGKK